MKNCADIHYTKIIDYELPARIHRPKTFADFKDFEQIQTQLKKNGILLEKWNAGASLAENAGADEVLAAYQSSIEKLKNSRGFKTQDVVAINPDTPNHSEMRKKFLQEHTHRDDEAGTL